MPGHPAKGNLVLGRRAASKHYPAACTTIDPMRWVAAVLVRYSGITCIVAVPGTGGIGAAVGAAVRGGAV